MRRIVDEVVEADASLADVFEGPETMPAEAWPRVREARVRLHHLINETPHLDWLLLTKRPENVVRFAEGPERSWTENTPPNVWLGASVENRAEVGRIDVLRRVTAAVRFLSVEPLLEDLGRLDLSGIDWCIVGGESGGGARPMNVEWARSLVRQCRAAGVKVFVKQLGANPTQLDVGGTFDRAFVRTTQLRLRDRKGGDMDEFPADLRVREFPR